MNFFGHLVAAAWVRPSPSFGLGAMLPDLLPMCGAQPAATLPPPLAEGIAFHHRTDGAFHDRPAFVAVLREARAWLLDHGVPRGPALAAAHVGIELLLDGVLADDEAGSFATALEQPVPWQSPLDAARFSHLRHGLLAAGVPATYADPNAVASRLVRILGRRPRLRLDDRGATSMHAFTEAFAPRVRGCTPRILDELRDALTAA